jgi:hypothetical protein
MMKGAEIHSEAEVFAKLGLELPTTAPSGTYPFLVHYIIIILSI